MNIHIVQPGDTIYTIASQYGISPEQLAEENDIRDFNNLNLGEALIVIRAAQIHIVQEGDSLESIAMNYGISVMELLRNNPNNSDGILEVGEELVISYEEERRGTLKTNGFAYPFIERDILRKTLPYLTFLTVYSYEITQDGNLVDIDDSDIIEMSKEYKVVPIMFITAPSSESGVDTNILHNIISDMQARTNFIDSILMILHSKGYSGINIDTPFVQPQDREPYVELIDQITKLLNSEGFTVMITLAPSTFEVSTGLIYEGVDYIGLSRAANGVLYQLTYAWRFPNNLPISILPFDAVLQTFINAVQLLSPEKCMLGISIIGYLWEFPYFAAILNAYFLNYNSAMRLANLHSSVIRFNEPSYSSYFNYDDSGREYMAWFTDIRGLYPWITYTKDYELIGVNIWNIMYFMPSIWIFINSQYEIEKIV